MHLLQSLLGYSLSAAELEEFCLVKHSDLVIPNMYEVDTSQQNK